MRKFLRRVRNIRLVNSALRGTLKFSDKLIQKFIQRWPPFGELCLEFDSIKFKMYAKGDDPVATALYYKKYHEAKDLRLFLELVKSSQVIFDVGANTGIYSCL